MRPPEPTAIPHPPARLGLAAAVLLTALAGCGGASRTIPARPPAARVPIVADDPAGPDDAAGDLLDRHNRLRASRGLPPLGLAPALSEAARAQVAAMIATGKVRHTGADGSSPADRVERAGYRFLALAENVAGGQRSAQQVMDGWMRSPGHRRNILGDFEQMGAARGEDDDGRPYWCVVFATPAPRPARRGRPSARHRPRDRRGWPTLPDDPVRRRRNLTP